MDQEQQASRHPISSFMLEQPPEPAYLALYRSGELARRVEEAVASLQRCEVCPRLCRVDRLHAVAAEDAPPARRMRTGRGHRLVSSHIPSGTACFTGRHARISSAFPHFGEEDCLRGRRGSGTIFFSFCNLRCVFCQNWDISHVGEGHEARPEEIAERMLELQALGCHNINFVTPEHVVPQALEALLLAAAGGLRLPLVYNTSAYDSMHSLRLLDGVVDVYMPDFKYWSEEPARHFLKAADYPEAARLALREMHRQVGALRFDATGVARRGVLVRHLVMPGGLDESKAIFRFLADELSPDTWVNIMDQYRPSGCVEDESYPELARRTRPTEIAAAYDLAREAGLWRFDSRAPGLRLLAHW